MTTDSSKYYNHVQETATAFQRNRDKSKLLFAKSLCVFYFIGFKISDNRVVRGRDFYGQTSVSFCFKI